MAYFVPEVHAEKSKTEAWLNQVCTSIPDIFYRRKKWRELCWTETRHSTISWAVLLWHASMILIWCFSGLSDSFIAVILFHMFVWKIFLHVFRKRSWEGSSDSPLPLQMCPPWSGSKFRNWARCVSDMSRCRFRWLETLMRCCGHRVSRRSQFVGSSYAQLALLMLELSLQCRFLAISVCFSHWDPEVFVTVPCL